MIEIVAYDPAWPGLFAELGREFRAGLGDIARRIDHIGSTSVPGLGAKPVVDVQVSVAALEPLTAFKQPLERLGYVYRADAKVPFMWEVIRQADEWAQARGWLPGPSDA
jgi:GrpB-like predicted nucleotidyltransferase (UPF0157 family)